MPEFGTRSNNNLNECHIDLQVLFRNVIEHFDCAVIEGHRPQVDQNKAFHAGKSQLKWPESKHNKTPSMAADVMPYPINWQDTRRICLFAGYVLGIAEALHFDGTITHKVRWGGDFDMDFKIKDGAFFDGPHFELVPAD